MGAGLEHVVDGGLGLWADRGRPVQKALGIPAGHLLVGRCQMSRHGGVPARHGAAQMAGDALALGEDLHGADGEAHIDLRPGVRVGHRVVVPHQLHVIVDADPRHFPLGELMAGQREGFERGAIDGLEDALARARQLLAGARVERLQQRADGTIDLGQAEERLMA